jgi:hypothetical protein
LAFAPLSFGPCSFGSQKPDPAPMAFPGGPAWGSSGVASCPTFSEAWESSTCFRQPCDAFAAWLTRRCRTHPCIGSSGGCQRPVVDLPFPASRRPLVATTVTWALVSGRLRSCSGAAARSRQSPEGKESEA